MNSVRKKAVAFGLLIIPGIAAFIWGINFLGDSLVVSGVPNLTGIMIVVSSAAAALTSFILIFIFLGQGRLVDWISKEKSAVILTYDDSVWDAYLKLYVKSFIKQIRLIVIILLIAFGVPILIVSDMGDDFDTWVIISQMLLVLPVLFAAVSPFLLQFILGVKWNKQGIMITRQYLFDGNLHTIQGWGNKVESWELEKHAHFDTLNITYSTPGSRGGRGIMTVQVPITKEQEVLLDRIYEILGGRRGF